MRLAATLLAATLAGCAPAPATLTVDPSARHQTIAGWEVTARLWEFDKARDRFDGSWLARREEVAALLVDKIGIDRLRIELRSGAENPIDYWPRFVTGEIGYTEFKRHFYEKINDNADPTVLNPAGVQFSELDWRVETIVLPVKLRVEARGRRFGLNLNYVDFKWTTEKGTLSHAAHPDEYAELIVAAFMHLKAKYGLVPDSLELVLEPDNSDGWRGSGIGRAAVAVSARLAAAGFGGVRLIAPSTAKAQRALPYLAGIASVPGAAKLLSTLSYHRYDGAPDDDDLHALRDTARRSGLATAMLEHVDGGIAELLADLTEADVVAWQQYGIATRVAARGKVRPGWLILARERAGAPAALEPSRDARALALVFDAVDAGSVRVDTRADGGVAGAAFLTPAGRLVVVATAADGTPLTITGLPPGHYGLTRVVADESDAPPSEIVAAADGTVRLALTAETTISLVELDAKRQSVRSTSPR